MRNAEPNPVRVPLRLAVAFIWLATGMISAFVSASEGLRLLERTATKGVQ